MREGTAAALKVQSGNRVRWSCEIDTMIVISELERTGRGKMKTVSAFPDPTLLFSHQMETHSNVNFPPGTKQTLKTHFPVFLRLQCPSVAQ